VNAPQIFRSPESGLFGRRQKRERGARIPVTILTGFLGSGKTTLLKRFLETPEGSGTAVVVNEFGAVGIDDALLRSSTDTTTLLGNGCLCCTTRSDLQNTLRRLVTDRERGDIPDFRRVVIETSGLADPSPILQTFATDRALGGEFHVEAVIACADAVTGLETLNWSAEARKQAILADLIIVTKTDIADEVAAPRLVARLRELNSKAPVETAVSGALDPRWFTGQVTRIDASPFVAEAAHSDGVSSFTLTWDKPLLWTAFARTMETLIALRGSDLLRAKGFLAIDGALGPVLVQFVQHLAHPPVELDAWPDGERTSRLVFITRHIPQQAVTDLFAAINQVAATDAH
jgi:G3E family GTPase